MVLLNLLKVSLFGTDLLNVKSLIDSVALLLMPGGDMFVLLVATHTTNAVCSSSGSHTSPA